VRICANQTEVSQLVAALREDGAASGGWDTLFIDDSTGQRWRRTYLGSGHHGGGSPVLIQEPAPTVDELLTLVAGSPNLPEVAAGAWLLSELDPQGGYKERLVALAEEAARHDDLARAVLLVGWGGLDDDTNSRSSLGRHVVDVGRDHEHVQNIASRARRLLGLRHTAAPLKDLQVFGLGS
jgi:hypothetical protein